MAINATTGDGKKVILHTHYESQTKTVTRHKKNVSNILEISAIHQFADTLHESKEDGKEGYDWYFIKQSPLLNGAPGYDFHWAHTRQDVWTWKNSKNKVDEESWYVGEGEVALYYVSAYTLSASILGSPDKVEVYAVKPTALNENRSQTISSSCSVGGAFSGGVVPDSQGGIGGEGKISLNWGLNFGESETTTIYDCTCKNYTNGKSGVSWEYSFTKPNSSYQRLKNIPELSHSTFNPVNIWVWKVPTNQRKNVKSFRSEIRVDVASIITRYSGSQSAKIIPGDVGYTTLDVLLPVPPLLSCERDYLSINGNGGTKNVAIMTEYETLSFTFDEKPSCDWLKVEYQKAHTERSVLSITVDKLGASQENRSCTIKITGDNKGKKKGFQNSNDITESIELVILQSANLIE